MRLIDADNFMGFMTALEDAGAEYVPFDDLRKFINNQPTAYDVDKVVEQLEEKSDDYEDAVSSDPRFKRYCNGVSARYRFAIGIVKAGGANED